MKRLLWAIVLASFASAPALAIPGQTTAQFLAWSKSLTPHSTALEADRDEMSGGRIYHALLHLGTPPRVVYFSAEPASDGTMHYASLALQGVGTMNTYDVRKHRNVVISILGWVYGPNVAIDFGDARLVADEKMHTASTHIAVYRGKRFGYQLSGIDVAVMRLQDVDEAVRRAKACSTAECGD